MYLGASWAPWMEQAASQNHDSSGPKALPAIGRQRGSAGRGAPDTAPPTWTLGFRFGTDFGSRLVRICVWDRVASSYIITSENEKPRW